MVIAKTVMERSVLADLKRHMETVEYEKSKEKVRWANLARRTGTGMDHPLVLLALGATILLDFYTDNAQSVQVWMCDTEDFHEQYVASFACPLEFLRPTVDTFGLRTLFVLMLCCIYTLQGVLGFRRVL